MDSPRRSSSGLIRLAHGPWQVELAPAAGGSVARFDFKRGGDILPMFRPAAPESIAHADARGMGCFPLFPYSNRIELGWMGLQPNRPTFPLPIHGESWLRPWKVASAGNDAAVLSHRHDGRHGWPLAYAALQSFRLTDDGLLVELTLTNHAGRPAPGGFGLHPYFHRTPGTLIRASAETVWENGPDMLPRQRIAVPAGWRLDPPRRADDLLLDNCFGGWTGLAEILWPDRNLALRMTATAPLGHLVVYTPAGRDYLCAEPVSHCNNGFALAERGTADTGTLMLAPGATVTAAVAFLPRLLAG